MTGSIENDATPILGLARWGVIGVVCRQEKFLVIRRSQQVRAPGAFCFPGGEVERHESETVALRRELREELSAEIRPITRLWQNRGPSGVKLAWWQVELHPQMTLRPNPAEVASLHWLTADEILRLPELLSTNRDFLRALHAGRILLTS